MCLKKVQEHFQCSTPLKGLLIAHAAGTETSSEVRSALSAHTSPMADFCHQG